MTIDQDLEKIALQEQRLQFKHFDAEVAWTIGTALHHWQSTFNCTAFRFFRIR